MPRQKQQTAQNNTNIAPEFIDECSKIIDKCDVVIAKIKIKKDKNV